MESDKEKKEDLDMDEIEIILHDLDHFAQKVGKGEVKYLGKIRTLVVDLDLVDIASRVDEKSLSVLYLVKKLINDFWYNFATDASFGFPRESPTISLFSKDLGLFIQQTLHSEDNKTNIDEALNYLYKAIKGYYSCLWEIDKKAEDVYKREGGY